MSPEIPTDKIALQVWWALMWRTFPLALIAGTLAGMVIGSIAALLGATPADVQTPSALAGAILGIFVSVRVIRHLMSKGFGQYRLTVVTK